MAQSIARNQSLTLRETQERRRSDGDARWILSGECQTPTPIHLAHPALDDEGGHVVVAETGAGAEGHDQGLNGSFYAQAVTGSTLRHRIAPATSLVHLTFQWNTLDFHPYV